MKNLIIVSNIIAVIKILNVACFKTNIIEKVHSISGVKRKKHPFDTVFAGIMVNLCQFIFLA